MAVQNTSASTGPTLHMDDILVSPEWVTEHLDNPSLSIIDVRTVQEYDEGHLPGAVNLELSRWTTERDRVQGMLIDPGAFAHLAGSAGISRERAVVLYDANWGMPAARVLWSFRRYGHNQVAVLNGGWDVWEEQSLPVSREAPTPTPVEYNLPIETHQGDEHLADLEWLQGQIERDDLVILDTRSPAEYEQGHLPKAINWDWLNAVPVGEWQTLRAEDELQAELAALGVTPDREIVTYCRSGARAAHTYLVLRKLGFPRVRNYDGSWLEWSLRILGKAAH